MPIIYPLLGVLLIICLNYGRLLYRIFITLPRDIRIIITCLRINLFLYSMKRKNMTIAGHFDSKAENRKGKPCFYFEGETWTHDKIQNESYKIANYFQGLGYKKGDSIALFMENRPEFVCVWLGLSRIGVVTSLLNSNIKLESLDHCISNTNSTGIIFGTELSQPIQDVIDIGGLKNTSLFCIEDGNKIVTPVSAKHVNLTKILKGIEPSRTICSEDIGIDDLFIYIFTSGTTGLPKAVRMTHMKIFCFVVTKILTGLTEKDVLITPLPLYHGQGGIMGVTIALFDGVPVAILRKFSASKYWDECVRYGATASQNMGEIMRYLLNQPEKPMDKLHKVRLFVGNGVNPVIWRKFTERFRGVRIIETFGITEGNCNCMNLDGTVGACGYMPILLFPSLPVCIASVDPITGEIIRDPKTGLVKMAPVGVPGEWMGKIDKAKPLQQYHGYIDTAASETKILRDVKRKGDAWFRSGDLFLRDELGYLYFKERCGDTFRWKGENVSTAEVTKVVTNGCGIKGVVVYGVNVPGSEGKCGMAAVADPEGTLNLDKLAAEVNKALPSYARPLFLRALRDEIDVTGTFKIQKLKLLSEGFDIQKIHGDKVYFLKAGKYVPLDWELYENIVSGHLRM